MTDKLPWEVESGLTDDRLRLIAGAIASARADALAHYLPEFGDDPWCLGCRAYSWCRAAIRKLEGPQNPWLEIPMMENPQEFEMRVAGTPLRFYRGDANKPKGNTLRQSLPSGQRDLFAMLGEDEQPPEEWCWLLAIETDVDGTVLRIVVLQADSYGSVRNQWSVPFETPVPVLSVVTPFEREGVDLPDLVVGPKAAPAEEGTAKAAGSDHDDETLGPEEGNEDS